MFPVQISSRLRVYIDMVEDTFPNRGGYYCRIFGDDTMDFPRGEFTISRNEIRGYDTDKKTAEMRGRIIATNKAKTYFTR